MPAMPRLSLLMLAMLPAGAHAAMGQVASNYGFFAQDVATSQALSMFSNQPSATYYNPSYLARDRKGAVSAGYLYTDQELTADPQGTPTDADGNPVRIVENDVIEDASNYNVLLGFKSDLSTMLKSDRAMVLGFMLGAERSGERILSFSSESSQTAQSFRYGQQSLFLGLGAGLNVVPGFDVGAAARITLAANAELQAFSDLGGNTGFESLKVSAKPSIQPILSGTVDWGTVVCPGKRGCWLTGLETSLAWRYESELSANVDAKAVVPNAVATPGLPLALATIDAYTPETWSLGLMYRMHKLRVGFTGEYQMWTGLNDKFAEDTIRDQANLEFRDVFIPRVGFEYKASPNFSFLGGVSYERSPLLSLQSTDINFVDNNRTVIGLGFSYLIDQALFLSQPVRFDLGYQYHILEDRDFRIATTRNVGNEAGQQQPVAGCGDNARCEDVKAGGYSQAVNASLHLTF